MRERHRFIRGMVSWIGGRQVAVAYDREPRFAGSTKYPLRKMLAFAVDAITSFSVVPLRPSVMLLDITLPLMDGISLLKRLKADPALRGIPVVMLTTSSRHEDIVRAYEAGAASYITKPASLEEFLDLARKFEMYWVTVSKLPV